MSWFTPAVYLGALAIGLGIGALTGMFGVGGGFLVTPLLNVLLGVPMPFAVGTGLLQVLGTTSSGIYLRRKSGLMDLKLAVTLFGGNTVGVWLAPRRSIASSALPRCMCAARWWRPPISTR